MSVNNVKRISAVEIFPDSPTVIIGGQNQMGKSSLLDALVMALNGGKSIPPRPIRDGKSNAEIVVETDDLIVTRKFSQKGTSLVVTTKDGTPLSSPQAILDKLTGTLTFDPMEFSRICEKDPKRAVETLRQLAGLDFTQIDADRKRAYDDRTIVGRELDTEKGKLANLTHDPTAPKEEVSVAELAQKLKEANEQNAASENAYNEHQKKITSQENLIATTKASVDSADNRISELDNQIKELQSKLSSAKEIRGQRQLALESAESVLKGLKLGVVEKCVIDTSAIATEMANAQLVNAKVQSNKRRAELSNAVNYKTEEYNSFTATIEKLDEQKKDMLAKAKFPTSNISFDESGVLLDGVPFVQGSTAQRIKASLGMAMALNPGLRVVIIREGSMLDKNSMDLVSKMATESGYQVWLEKVCDSDDKAASVIIEDGTIKE